MCRFRLRLIACVALATIGLMAGAGPASAQLYTRRNWAPYQTATTALSAQIMANAEYVRAAGEYNRDTAEALSIRQDAIAKSIINRKEWVKAFFEIKELNHAKRMEHFLTANEQLNRRNTKSWELLRDNPEVTGPAITDGRALNFLLDRLAGTVLAYQISSSSQPRIEESNPRLTLDPKLIHGLQVRRDLPGGRELTFRIDEGVPLKKEWWPFALTGDEYASLRTNYDEARKEVLLAARNGAETHRAARKLSRAFGELDAAFRKNNDRETRFKSTAQWQQQERGRLFLKSLAREVVQLQESAGGLAEDDLRFQGKNVFALLTHMSRNGLRFAAAAPNDTRSYHQLFHLMRDMYVNVADDDSRNAPGPRGK